MSTDDFEAHLRGRLHDLADGEDGWDDPAPAARAYAAAGIAPDDDPDILAPVSAPARRKNPWPVLAVAAVVLAFVVAGGFGIRELARTGSSSSGAGSAAMAGQTSPEAADAAASPTTGGLSGSAAPGGGPISGSSGSGLSCPSGAGADCADLAGCAASGAATSTGPLAGNASIRPSGIVGPRTTSGGPVAVPYQLTFAAAGGTAQIAAAGVQRVSDGVLCNVSGAARPGVLQVVPVSPGGGQSGIATFDAVDSTGRPLPAGEYPVVVVITYDLPGADHVVPWQVVSTPVTVTVSS